MCYYVSSKIFRQEIFDLEQKFQIKWEDEDFQPFHVASGFSHPKLPVLTAEVCTLSSFSFLRLYPYKTKIVIEREGIPRNRTQLFVQYMVLKRKTLKYIRKVDRPTAARSRA
jgi:hypothetical protein